MVSFLFSLPYACKTFGYFFSSSHDTHGRALDNIEVALERGLRVVDSATGGLGGCPYGGSGAKGNVSTEAVLGRLKKLGFDTGVDEQLIQETGRFIRTHMQNLQS